MNTIKINNDIYRDAALIECGCSLVTSVTSDALEYDTLSVTVISHNDNFGVFRPSNYSRLITANHKIFATAISEDTDPKTYKYGDAILAYHDDFLIGKFYISSVTRTGKYTYAIEATSGIGLLANSDFYGGIYDGVTMQAMLTDIFGGIVGFTLDPVYKDTLLYGWLPKTTRREALHQVLFATSAGVKKDNSGEVLITEITDETTKNIESNRIYEGGSVTASNAASMVTLSEHAYIALDTDTLKTLYEGEIASDEILCPSGEVRTGGLIVFDDPMHDLSITGSTILESGCNYAVLSPSAECSLTGLEYSHTVHQVIRPRNYSEVSGTENKVIVEDATLVSVVNSENIADRLMSYYGSAEKVQMDIVTKDERAGDAVQFEDPFDEDNAGLITRMDVTMSGILKSTVEIVTGYKPPNAGNNYTAVDILTGSGVYTVPEGVGDTIRVVIIGGGTGGWSGDKGGNGNPGGLDYTKLYPGEGGAVGQGGIGGRILIKTLEVSAGDTFNYASGKGGAGGVCTSEGTQAGKEGTASTFGGFTSADGTASSTGYTDVISHIVYGSSGDAGLYAGATGGEGSNYGDGTAGGDVTVDGITYHGGAGSKYREKSSSKGTYYGGAGGGGAAAGQNGSDSTSAPYGGGGANSTLVNAAPTTIGKGGTGGNGGGGGGSGGINAGSVAFEGGVYKYAGDGGSGGTGSDGSVGAAGGILVYRLGAAS